MFKVETLKNGMIVFDNGSDVMEIRSESIWMIRKFAPEPNSKCYGDETICWRLQVVGTKDVTAWFQFKSPCKKEIDDVLCKINKILDVATLMKERKGCNKK